MKLEEEAKAYTQKKAKPKEPSLTTVRYYTGCALTALLSKSNVGREPELIKEAFRLGRLMAEKEQEE